MKLYIKHKTLILESQLLISVIGWLSSGQYGYQQAKAAALFPVIIIRNQQVLTPIVLNHERIHHRQQLETLYIGLWLISALESAYSRIWLKLPAQERYFYQASEQEAHQHQTDLDYLHKRRAFSVYHYIFHKKHLSYIPGKEPEVMISNWTKII